MSITATLGTDVPGGNIQVEQKFFRAYGTLAFTGNYATGGVALSFAGKVPISNAVPVHVKINGISGYVYQYVKATKKVKVFVVPGFTPAGTVAAPTITTTTNAGTTTPLYTNGGALTQVAGETGVTGVQAPAFTGTAVDPAGMAELAAAAFPAGVTGDTVYFEAIFPKV